MTVGYNAWLDFFHHFRVSVPPSTGGSAVARQFCDVVVPLRIRLFVGLGGPAILRDADDR